MQNNQQLNKHNHHHHSSKKKKTKKHRFYSREDLQPYNLLSQPIWVFDIENRSMWWANESALELWNADTLDSLLKRDFASDMSDATARTLDDYLIKFHKGETLTARWTYYPSGKGPTTVDVLLSGMYAVEGRLLMLNEGHILAKDEIDKESLRGVEMLKHLPVSVCQFDVSGKLMHQNPEALDVFGNPTIEKNSNNNKNNCKKRKCPSSSPTGGDSSSNSSGSDSGNDDGNDEDEDTTSTSGNVSSSSSSSSLKDCHFRSRFVDEELGQRIFDEVVNGGKDHCVDAQQYTKRGIRWKSIKVRCARDPVTGANSILYSARDITDVVQAKKEADEANARKSEFLAVMAHEIRTPLHQVIGTIDLLGQTELKKEQTEFVSVLQSGALSLMAVINDLLDYTKLEAGKMELEFIPFDARAVVDGSVAAVTSRGEEKGLHIGTCFDRTDEIPSDLIGDPNRLRQILLNLLSNAVKFTHEGNVIARVKSMCHDDNKCNNNHGGGGGDRKCRLRFEVEDTGIGIRDDFQKEIFRKYHQADNTISGKYGGTGLGLAICERLVHMMGGQIGIESEVSKGSTFWFELSFDRSHKKQKTSPGETTKVSRLQKSSSSSTRRRSATSEDGVDSLNVLVAEDNRVNQKVITAMLKRLGHNPTIVENGLLAVEELSSSSTKFDMVLMDIQMPVLDGIGATKKIRSKGISCPVIGLTASFQRTELPFYHEVGMNDCISKPIRLDGLRNTIDQNRKVSTPASKSC